MQKLISFILILGCATNYINCYVIPICSSTNKFSSLCCGDFFNSGCLTGDEFTFKDWKSELRRSQPFTFQDQIWSLLDCLDTDNKIGCPVDWDEVQILLIVGDIETLVTDFLQFYYNYLGKFFSSVSEWNVLMVLFNPIITLGILPYALYKILIFPVNIIKHQIAQKLKKVKADEKLPEDCQVCILVNSKSITLSTDEVLET